MEVTFKIRRYNPESSDAKSYWQEFTLQDVEPTNRVLEMLHRVKWEQDGTLAFRRSCSSGICVANNALAGWQTTQRNAHATAAVDHV